MSGARGLALALGRAADLDRAGLGRGDRVAQELAGLCDLVARRRAELASRYSAAAASTAHTIASQSASGSRVMVTKSLTPNTDATPSNASTAWANSESVPSPRVVSMRVASVTSSVNFIALGFGVVDGRTVATHARLCRG